MKTMTLQPAVILQSIQQCLEEDRRRRNGAPDHRQDALFDDMDDDIPSLEGENDEEIRPLNPEKKDGNELDTAASGSNLSTYIRMLREHPSLETYQLNENDVLAIACLWDSMLSGPSDGLSWRKILDWCKLDSSDVLGGLQYLGTLLDRNIIVNTEETETDFHLDPFLLLEGEYLLHNQFRFILSQTKPQDKIEAALYSSWENLTQLNRDLVLARKLAQALYPNLNEYRRDGLRYNLNLLDCYLNPLKSRIASSQQSIPLLQLIGEHTLSDIDLIILLWVYTDQLLREHASLNHLANLISHNHIDRLDKMIYLKNSATLIAAGICIIKAYCYDSQHDFLSFTDETAKRLNLRTEDDDDEKDEASDSAQQHYNMRELSALQSFDDLILPAGDRELLSAAIRRYLNKEDTDLSQWGVKLPMTEMQQSQGKGTCILLYGESGTGKTFSAGAIANALSKKLLAIDASQLRNKYYGETEKVVRRTFAEMRKVVESSDNPPVFLLNEADQIIHRRSKQESSCSSVENALQNIFLEELETFPGILILTTNLVENIDEAYFRRFEIKIELHRPDYECRLKLWELHLPESIPGASEIDCEYLASNYDLSGGQIDLVTRNACSDAISRSGSGKRLLMGDLIRYAILENPQGCASEASPRIGFCI